MASSLRPISPQATKAKARIAGLLDELLHLSIDLLALLHTQLQTNLGITSTSTSSVANQLCPSRLLTVGAELPSLLLSKEALRPLVDYLRDGDKESALSYHLSEWTNLLKDSDKSGGTGEWKVSVRVLMDKVN